MAVTVHGRTRILEIKGKHYIVASAVNEYHDVFYFVGEVIDVDKGEVIKTFAQAEAVARRMAEED